MNKKLLIIFLILVLLPLGLITGLGSIYLSTASERSRNQIEGYLQEELSVHNKTIAEKIKGLETNILVHLALVTDKKSARSLMRLAPIVEQIYLLSPKGDIRYPNKKGFLNEREKHFLQINQRFLVEKELYNKF